MFALSSFRGFPGARILRGLQLAGGIFALGLAAPHSAEAVVLFDENFEGTPQGSLPAGWSSFAAGTNLFPSVVLLDANSVLKMEDFGTNFPRIVTSAMPLTAYTNWSVTLSFDLKYVPSSNAFSPDTTLSVGLTESNQRPFGVSTWVGGNYVGAPSGNEIYVPYDTWTNITLDLSSRLPDEPGSDGIVMYLSSTFLPTGAVAYLDNFQVTAVPEPAAGLLMLGAGLAMAVGRGRGRR
ncbi:MAG: hypothetical protein HUU04_11450 [Verrucomicrobiae bacterium]|nr:hypothetical protein [Verrucomicrobiae bacterium]